jgi:hypothetical protein
MPVQPTDFAEEAFFHHSFFTIHSSPFTLHHSPHGFQNSHRKSYRHPDAHYESPESLSPTELESVKDLTQAELFSIDRSNPDAGGTWHTVRVCRNAKILTVFQNDWKTWMNQLS